MLENSAYGRKRVFLACLTILFINALAGCGGETSAAAQAPPLFQQGNAKRGEYLSKVYSCQECHTVRQADGIHLDEKLLFAGGEPYPGSDGSLVYSANVTLSGEYANQVLDSLIRGRLAYKFTMPTTLYNGMAADDMRDLIAYLKTLNPVLRPLPDNHLPPNFVFPAPTQPVPIPEHEPAVGTVERGAYLSRMFACLDCHSPRDSTGAYDQAHLFEGQRFQIRLPDGRLLVASNLTPDLETGLGAWSDAEIIRATRTGVARDGRQLNHVMPYVGAYRDMTDQDAADLVRFLRSLEPVKRPWTSQP
jgi:mono/diheme cytochrome c family protein